MPIKKIKSTKKIKKPTTKQAPGKTKVPRDPHAEVAARMFNTSPGKVTWEQREAVKRFNLLQRYGGARFPFPFVTSPVVANAAVPAWRTKDGRVIPVSTMSDAHLANAMAMLYRKLGPLMAEANKRAQRDESGGGDVSDFPRDVDFGDLF